MRLPMLKKLSISLAIVMQACSPFGDFWDAKNAGSARNSVTATATACGCNWTGETLPATTSHWSGVAYGSGIFAAVASTTGFTAHSTDGVTWYAGTNTTPTQSWNSLAYGTGGFVTLDGSGAGTLS